MTHPVLSALEADASLDAATLFTRLAAEYLADTRSGEGPVSTGHTPAELYARFDEPLPRGGHALEEVVARIRDEIVPDCNRLYHPRAVGHQVSPPLPAAVWTEAVTAALNQSTAVFEMSPALTAVETRTVRWLCELVGFGAGSGGTLTSGGTEATFTALLAARAHALPDAWQEGVGADPPVVLCGEHAHYAVTRAVAQLGLGMRSVVAVPSEGFAMRAAALGERLESLARDGRRVMAVVATAGSTATGSFDDLDVIGTLCEAHDVWLHVDAAHGGSALLSGAHRHRLRGIERARTVAWDPHKMMLLPLQAGVLLARDEGSLERAFAQRAPYLFHANDDERVWDQGVRSFLCSHRADALKLWVALQRYGADGIGALYDHLCETARAMWELLGERPAFARLHAPESNILCWRWVGDGTHDDGTLDRVTRAMRERLNRSGAGWITTTVLGGRRVLRVTVMNPRTTRSDLVAILDALEREASAVLRDGHDARPTSL